MAEAGFNPENRLTWLVREYKLEVANLRGSEDRPEFLSTHPSVSFTQIFQFINWHDDQTENRIKLAETIMSEARRIFEKKDSITKTFIGWDDFRSSIEDRHYNYVQKGAEKERHKPERCEG